MRLLQRVGAFWFTKHGRLDKRNKCSTSTRQAQWRNESLGEIRSGSV